MGTDIMESNTTKVGKTMIGDNLYSLRKLVQRVMYMMKIRRNG